MTIEITATNIDELLDSGRIEVQMRNGNWCKVRRNGATKRFQRYPKRFYVSIKTDVYVEYTSITHTGTIDFRVVD